jgi:hypothetical protein
MLRASVRPMPRADEVAHSFPGRKMDDVTYPCEECGGEIMRRRRQERAAGGCIQLRAYLGDCTSCVGFST